MKLCPFYQLDREIIVCGQYDQALHAFFKRFVRPGMVCIDAGANIGDSTLHLAQLVGPTGHVYAFEPAPFPRSRLAEHVAANDFGDRVSINACALSDKDGTASFAFSESGMENQGMGSLVNRDNGVVQCSTDVTLQSLDAYVRELKMSKVDLIKVDIQGAEPMFLKGAESTIREQRPVICMEISPLDLAASGTDVPGLVRIIEAMDYVVHTLNHDGTSGPAVASYALSKEYRADNVICLPIASGGSGHSA